MYSEIELYVIDCIAKGKKPSGRKILDADIDRRELYCVAQKITPPGCAVCTKPARFISISKGFGKYCSKQCYSVGMSRRNSTNNKHRNKRVADAVRSARYEKYQDILLACEAEYSSSIITVEQLSEKYGIEKQFLRQHFRKNKLIDASRQIKVRKNNLLHKTGFQNINDQLDDLDWVQAQLDAGWASRTFAQHLQCSINYVCTYIRNKHPDIVWNNGSSYETELSDFLSEIQVNHDMRRRDIIPPRELDIYVPEHKLAIEVNGIYWHGGDNKHRNYHLDKTVACANQGIRLLHFTDSEIDHKRLCVKSIIKSAVGQSNTIHARKCDVVNLTSAVYKSFCDANHIQGYAAASQRLGLIHEGQLVAVMSFAKPRFNTQYDYEIIRYCNLLDHTVVGGAQKLFKYFILNHSCDSVISYCQRRLFTGNMYLQLGMSFLRHTPPNYLWINKHNETLTRYQTQKHMISDPNNPMSEKEIMKNRGYYQIFDCGQSVYEWHRTENHATINTI